MGEDVNRAKSFQNPPQRREGTGDTEEPSIGHNEVLIAHIPHPYNVGPRVSPGGIFEHGRVNLRYVFGCVQEFKGTFSPWSRV